MDTNRALFTKTHNTLQTWMRSYQTSTKELKTVEETVGKSPEMIEKE